MTEQKQVRKQSNQSQKRVDQDKNLLQESYKPVERLAGELQSMNDTIDDILADIIPTGEEKTQVIRASQQRPLLRQSSEEFVNNFRQTTGQ